MESLIGLLITVIIIGLVMYLLYWLVGQIPLPAPFKVVATVLLALVTVVLLLGLLFGGVSVPVLRLR
jgi:hypothetical protein